MSGIIYRNNLANSKEIITMTSRHLRHALTKGPDTLIKAQALREKALLSKENEKRELRKTRINMAIGNVNDPIDTPIEVDAFTAGKNISINPIDTPSEMLQYFKMAITGLGKLVDKKEHSKDENQEKSCYSRPTQ